jgi:hypothetical protein
LRGVKRRNDREKNEREKSFHHGVTDYRETLILAFPEGAGTALWCNLRRHAKAED